MVHIVYMICSHKHESIFGNILFPSKNKNIFMFFWQYSLFLQHTLSIQMSAFLSDWVGYNKHCMISKCFNVFSFLFDVNFNIEDTRFWPTGLHTLIRSWICPIYEDYKTALLSTQKFTLSEIAPFFYDLNKLRPSLLIQGMHTLFVNCKPCFGTKC